MELQTEKFWLLKHFNYEHLLNKKSELLVSAATKINY